MVVFDGFIRKGMADIYRYFDLPKGTLDPYKSTFETAKMILKAKVQRKTISMGMSRDDVTLTFHLNKQYAEQINDPVHDVVEADVTSAFVLELDVPPDSTDSTDAT